MSADECRLVSDKATGSESTPTPDDTEVRFAEWRAAINHRHAPDPWDPEWDDFLAQTHARIVANAVTAARAEGAVPTARPYAPGTPLVAVSKTAWEEAQEAECRVPELQDECANSQAYIKALPGRIADFLLTYSGDGEASDAWQAGHNYAMREAARMVREGWHNLPHALDGSALTSGDQS